MVIYLDSDTSFSPKRKKKYLYKKHFIQIAIITHWATLHVIVNVLQTQQG